MTTDFDQELMYHWSPSINRESIKEHGLKIRQPSLQGGWKAPFISFGPSPVEALSSVDDPLREVRITSWDLWAVWSGSIVHREALSYDNGEMDGTFVPKEFRVYRNIKAADVIYIATRSNIGNE